MLASRAVLAIGAVCAVGTIGACGSGSTRIALVTLVAFCSGIALVAFIALGSLSALGACRNTKSERASVKSDGRSFAGGKRRGSGRSFLQLINSRRCGGNALFGMIEQIGGDQVTVLPSSNRVRHYAPTSAEPTSASPTTAAPEAAEAAIETPKFS